MKETVKKLEIQLQNHIENTDKKSESTDAKIDELSSKLDVLMEKLLPS